jgi:DNA-directed RNA polymerase subunit N (RpoN/RPB10)
MTAKKPAKLIWDEAYWLDRAEEARTLLEDIRHPECRRIMSEMAESYERLAEQTKRFREAARDQSDVGVGGSDASCCRRPLARHLDWLHIL